MMERYRIGSESALHYVTYFIVDWLPVFVCEESCKIVTDSLAFCHQEKQLRINAYVVMPTHMHMIVFDAASDTERLAQTLAEMRKFTGRRLCNYCGRHAPRCFRPAFARAAATDRRRRFWQPSRHPEVIVGERFWRQKFDYIHANPCRKGLVRRAEDWRFSSARWHSSDGVEPAELPLSPIVW